jgi:hypothetical protein
LVVVENERLGGLEPTQVGAVVYVNRGLRRTRHLDRKCRGLDLARQELPSRAEARKEAKASGLHPDEVPSFETRIVRVKVTDADEAAAIDAFTMPCKLCVPGAKALGEHVPFYFENE